MPHIVLEHAAPLAAALNIPQLLLDLHQALAGVETIDPDAIKTRAVPVTDFLTGTSGTAKPFVHLTLSILVGRPDAVVRTAGETLFAVLNRHIAAGSEDCAVSLYLHEMPPVRYWK